MKYTINPPKRRFFLPPAAPAHLIGTVKCDGLPLATPGGWFSIDTETTGLDSWGKKGVDRVLEPARPFMFTLCNADGETACIRWQVDPTTRRVYRDDASFALLNTLLQDESITKVMHNAPFDFRMLRLSGFTIRGPILDTIMGMHTISPAEFTFGLKPLAEKYLQIPSEDQDQLHKSTMAARRPVQAAKRAKEKGKPYDEILANYQIHEDVEADYFLGDEAICEAYGRQDAYRTAALYLAIREELGKDEALTQLYVRETELGVVLRAMEDRGIRIDKERTESLITYYEGIKEEWSRTIIAEAGQGFNPNSPKQMTGEFFGKRGFIPLKYSFNKQKKEYTKCMHCKGSGCNVCQETGRNPSCDGDFLASVGIDHSTDEDGNDILVAKDRLAFALLHDSAADTMLSYVRQYRDFMVFENGVWVLHPNYKQHGTKTSRLSAEKPNMQNVATDESGKKKVDIPYRSRECFIPRDDFVFFIPDYSQIEVWILFLRAQAYDPRASEALALLAAGGDAHQIVSTYLWGHKYDVEMAKISEKKKTEDLVGQELINFKLHKELRKRAKSVQFCKTYGGGIEKLATTIGGGCTREEAAEFDADYDERLPFVRVFMKETIRQAKREGFIRNAYGRIFFVEKQFAYRATNYDIQGSAADLIKNAMRYSYALTQQPLYLGKLFLLLSIHDELLFEVHKSIDNQTTQKSIAECMSRDYEFLGCPIPFPIGMAISNERWSDTTYKVKL